MLTHEPVVQIHLSRFCNLKCLHCYSSSGPAEREALSVEDVLRTTAELSRAGYLRAALSGGEPVLAPGFHDLAAGLTSQGFRVGVITNGTRPAPLLEVMAAGDVQHASISFDGPENLHDTIRSRSGAFRRAIRTLERLAERNLSRGVVLSATRQSLPHLPDLVDLLVAAGAQHVQLHPIAAAGRARTEEQIVGPELAPEAMLRLLAMGRVLQVLHADVQIQVDVLLAGARLRPKLCEGDLVSPLVIVDDGAILPYCFDISRSYTLGHVTDPNLDIRPNPELCALVDRAAARLSSGRATNLYRYIVELSSTPHLSHAEH
ncbi:radical SAM protein [Sulfitobacter pacificus]|uniref:radical SAM protein n=1 Tax=Sulfitobacter pacificus TaxID=1499314 RepID=UPI003103414C